MRSKKAVFLILMGIAIAAVPFLLRMREQQRAGQYMEQFEEDGDEDETRKETGSLLFTAAGFFTRLILISVLLQLIDILPCPLLLPHPQKKRDSRYGYPHQD